MEQVTYKGTSDGVLLYDGVMHAEWWCSWSCLVRQMESNGNTPAEIWEMISSSYCDPAQWNYQGFSDELVSGVTVCGSVV